MQEAVRQIQQAPLTYQIQVMELLLQSLKAEITQNQSLQKTYKPFRVRTFNLGRELAVDREAMYGEFSHKWNLIRTHLAS